jgi:branched-chain amino acid transport system ATP-binding protein
MKTAAKRPSGAPLARIAGAPVDHVLLRISTLSKRFGGIVATDDLALSVRRGETHAVIGPNGAGKSTLIAQVSGSLAPDRGAIVFDGVDVTRRSVHQRAMLGFARSFQITSVFPSFSVVDNVALAVQAGIGSSLRFWRAVRDEAAIGAAAREIVAQVGLADVADANAGALSHGEHRQLELGIALATRPKLLLLDEPMAGMGPDESARMVALIERLKPRFTILLVEHDMDAVFRLADRISVLVAGRIIATGSVDAIRANEEVRAAYLGEDEGAW